MKESNTEISLLLDIDTDKNKLVNNTNNNTNNNEIFTELDTGGDNNSNIMILTND